MQWFSLTSARAYKVVARLPARPLWRGRRFYHFVQLEYGTGTPQTPYERLELGGFIGIYTHAPRLLHRELLSYTLALLYIGKVDDPMAALTGL